MSDYTPSLDDLRAGFLDMYADEALGRAEFDRAIAKVHAEAKAEALREAADKFQTGDWFNVIQGNARVKIGNGQRVTDWLRARADKLVTE